LTGYLTNTSIGSYGRFANGAYQVCALIGIARKNGLQPVFPLWQNKDHAERFGSKEDIDVYKHFVNHLPPIPEGVQFIHKPIEWGYHDVVLPEGNWNISGHFQSFRYFEHCADEVRYYMRMSGEKQIDACAIHYRAGDYQHGQQSYHPRMPLEYYERTIEHFSAQQKYLLFSDDTDEAAKMCKELRIDFDISTGKDYIEDFRLMKGCRHFIIANSSYSALAAWLGDSLDKKVVSPSGYNWFGEAAEINGNDIPHESWAQIRFDKRNIKVA
jgi:hypothetical protein